MNVLAELKVATIRQLKANRAKTVIIRGLPVSTDLSDHENVVHLCNQEFDFQTHVLFCKRLGVSIEGRVQPLLVKLQTAEQASRLTTNARHLRNSANPFVKQNVYISANKTKAEAKAAFELRCQKRTSVQNRAQQQADKSTSNVETSNRCRQQLEQSQNNDNNKQDSRELNPLAAECNTPMLPIVVSFMTNEQPTAETVASSTLKPNVNESTISQQQSQQITTPTPTSSSSTQ